MTNGDRGSAKATVSLLIALSINEPATKLHV